MREQENSKMGGTMSNTSLDRNKTCNIQGITLEHWLLEGDGTKDNRGLNQEQQAAVTSSVNTVAAAGAGCAFNLLLFAAFYFLPFAGEKMRLFAVINLLLAVFNLLPLKELDGHILLERALLCAFSPEKAARSLDVCEKILLIFIVPAAAVLVFSGYMSFSAIIFLFYLLAVDIFDKM